VKKDAYKNEVAGGLGLSHLLNETAN